MNNLRILVAGLFACCSSVLFMNFDTLKQDDPYVFKRPMQRNNGIAIFMLRNANDTPLAGAMITLSMVQKQGGTGITYTKESSLTGNVYFNNLAAGTYTYRVIAKGNGNGGVTRIGKVQVSNFTEAEVLLTLP